MAKKQYRGCSKLVYATITEAQDGTITYGTPKQIAPVKSIARTIDEASEEVWADNTLQETTYGGKRITRSFEVTPLTNDVEADLFGMDPVTIVGTEKAYATNDNGDRPYFAIGYALHDGKPDLEDACEVVWAFRGRAMSLTKSSATIQQGNTTSEGQTLEMEFVAPTQKFTSTGKRNLDVNAPHNDNSTWDVADWFTQVVTPDNIGTILG